MTSSSNASRGGRLRALKRDARHAAGLGPTGWADMLRAIAELAIARIRLGTVETRALLSRAQAPQASAPVKELDRRSNALVDRVSFAIPRAGRRVPWRADCLVQALAAQHWLSRRGVATTLVIGVDKPRPADFEAHAWLMAADRIVTGGPVARYHPIFKQA